MAEPAVIAANRFGLGARPGELAEIRRDPRAWLSRQIKAAPALPPALAALPSMTQRAASLPDPKTLKAGDGDGKKQVRDTLRRLYLDDISARLSTQVTAEATFYERLVQFWSNHFTVSGTRLQVLGFIGAFELEAIRPHVLGRFADLLLAAALHPAAVCWGTGRTSTL